MERGTRTGAAPALWSVRGAAPPPWDRTRHLRRLSRACHVPRSFRPLMVSLHRKAYGALRHKVKLHRSIPLHLTGPRSARVDVERISVRGYSLAFVSVRFRCYG